MQFSDELRLLLRAKSEQHRSSLKKNRPPHAQFPINVERAYAAMISKLIKQLHKLTMSYIKDKAAKWEKENARHDSLGFDLNQLVQTLLAQQQEWFTDGRKGNMIAAILGFGQKTSDFNKSEWKKQLAFAVGNPIYPAESWLSQMLVNWAMLNRKLVKSLTGTYIDRMSAIVQDSFAQGMLWKDVQKRLQATFSTLSDARARLIARDQIGKLNANLTKARHEQAGINAYEWLTSMDERVRDSHKPLNGLICRHSDTLCSHDNGKTWEARPAEATLAAPGEDIQCRCTAIPFYSELLENI